MAVGGSNLRNFFTVMGVHTFVDMLASTLAQGIKLRDTATKFVKFFIQEVMRILGIPERVASDNPNQVFSFFAQYLVAAFE
ncbi:ABC transporter substrate-binding protein [Teredinibacter turnerae]|uniref:ABC transporter substrate-binding protein n=1 Tax=Teredinibacter turnerae TaxID=2426 RepID=UPI001F077C69|nr:ABC transporter substrate-binding protein [Teredinibacter turnerae]